MTGPNEEEIAHWQQWVGKSQAITERIEPLVLRRYAAALGETYDERGAMPSLAHWAFFLEAVLPDALGPDGHPKRGGFLPPISLPRRMFAASDMQFLAPLMTGDSATKTSRVASLTHKSGRSGALILVEVEHSIEQAGALCIREMQTLVYRDASAPTAPIENRHLFPATGEQLWQPGPVDLFRFSAVTFNSHRIHYDLPYAQHDEGYPGLVVHGPFTAARLFAFAQNRYGPLRRFSFRAQAPMFAGQPIILRSGGEENQVCAVRCDGVEAFAAHFEI
ncbi:MAG: MaoC family dehydratase N-terminal domain-containing protein [Sphingobium sp.]|nr:MaoC family dehydratase N-terminal domain-containing protein [Sphingobium sp.]MBP8671551.1 MaoC family dehydratase N-terminal domain-containing protein [Sphingobium sp.]MBP9156935.1 MaoC family dehydratase N-terminal domain-containing protein [Sphingobium sp.]